MRTQGLGSAVESLCRKPGPSWEPGACGLSRETETAPSGLRVSLDLLAGHAIWDGCFFGLTGQALAKPIKIAPSVLCKNLRAWLRVSTQRVLAANITTTLTTVTIIITIVVNICLNALFYFSSLDSKKLGREGMQKRQREGEVSEGEKVEEGVKQKNTDWAENKAFTINHTLHSKQILVEMF